MDDDVTLPAGRVEINVTAIAGKVGSRSYLSTWMLRSAQRFATQAQDIEDSHQGLWASPHAEELTDLVISSVITSAAFLEAMVNELFTDASERHGVVHDGYLATLDESVIRLMADWWEETGQGFDRTLVKYQLLLSFARQERLDKGGEPYQSADLLLRLRNTIVHYRPRTVFGDELNRLEQGLKPKFQRNQLFPPDASPWWPNGALGAGCAHWAHTTARRLADEVCDRLGIVPRYRRILL